MSKAFILYCIAFFMPVAITIFIHYTYKITNNNNLVRDYPNKPIREYGVNK